MHRPSGSLHRPSGAARFVRYAYPPNELGYCGPADPGTLLVAGDAEVARRARLFDGAWPYLEMLAEGTGVGDPLDARLVEAYWLGGPLLDRVDPARFAHQVRTRFRGQVRDGWPTLAPDHPVPAVAHHSFHVFAVYPWVGLLAGRGGHALRVLDQCRVRWGRVSHVDTDRFAVRSRPLVFDGRALGFGPVRTEAVRASGLVGVRVGDWLSLHWDWACERLTPTGLRWLRHYTARQLDLTNRCLAGPSGGATPVG